MNPISDRRRAATELLRFLFVGMLNTAFGYCLYAAGIFAGLAPEIALLMTFAAAMVFNYLTTGRLVFRSSGKRHFPKFAFAYLLIYCINALALRAVLNLGVQPLLGQAIVLPPIVICTFLTMKFFVFRNSNAQDH